MSTVHKLLHIGIAAFLAWGLAGCGYGTATTVLSDIASEDTQSPCESFPVLSMGNESLPAGAVASVSEASSIADGKAETPKPDSPPGKKKAKAKRTVADITPAFRAAIRAKKAENKHTVGWLQVPGTDINRQIVQNPEKNNPYPLKNNYYLNRDFEGNPDKNGTFCADHRAAFGKGRKSLSRITALYGHSWDDDPDGELFSQLKRFRDPDFARDHPYIFFSTESNNMAWEVFAVFDTTIYLPYVRPNLAGDKYDQMLEMAFDLSYYNYDVAVRDRDKILVLSTCTYSVAGQPYLPELNDYRFVVMARLAEPSEPLKREAVFAVNSSPALPDETRKLSHL